MKLAVLIPVYNAERYLAECLDSVLLAGRMLESREGIAHTLDVFCCDDGSGDGSKAILAEYSIRFANVHYTTQENCGVVRTRNRLMDELPAEYDAFAFVDSDDLVAPETYAVLAEAMMRTDADVAESGMPGNEVASERVIDDMSLYLLRRTAPGPWINVVNKLYRRTAVSGIRFRVGLCFEEDLFFNYEVNSVIRRKVLVPGVFYSYRDNPNSATHVLNQRRYFDSTILRIRLSLEVFLRTGRIPAALEKEWRRELAKDAYRMCLRKNLKKNRDPQSRRELFAEAGCAFAQLEREYGFSPDGLNLVQRWIYDACRKGRYWLASALVNLT